MPKESGRKYNIDDIARMAFVSRSVVSRVLNNHANVSQGARERVEKVIKQVGYVPNSLARSLAKKRTCEVAILAPRRKDVVLANGFWSLLFLGISEECLHRGFYASLNTVSREYDKALKRRLLRDRNVDGHIIIGAEVGEATQEDLGKLGKPRVVVGRLQEESDLPYVDVKNAEAGFDAADHLFAHGHERLGFISGYLHNTESWDRYSGFKRAHRKWGVTPNQEMRIEIEYSQRGGYNAMKQLLPKEPTGVVCASDAQAMGALLAAYEAGLRVPRDISVMGFDDLPQARFTIPPLTTMRQPIYDMGQSAAALLIDQIEGQDKANFAAHMDATLIERQSCGPPPG